MRLNRLLAHSSKSTAAASLNLAIDSFYSTWERLRLDRPIDCAFSKTFSTDFTVDIADSTAFLASISLRSI